MEIKFFIKDAIGKKPTKVGDVFEAKFMGTKRKFRVTEWWGDNGFMAKLI